MSTKRRDSLEVEHLRLLDELDSLALTDSCCEICHCDCFSSHRSTDFSDFNTTTKKKTNKKKVIKDNNNNNNNKNCSKQKRCEKSKTSVCNKVKVKRKSTPSPSLHTQSLERYYTLRSRSRSRSPASIKKPTLKRSKSAGSLHAIETFQKPRLKKSNFTRDCELLQDLLTSLETPRLEIKGESSTQYHQQQHPNTPMRASKSSLELPTTSKAALLDTDARWSRPKICESLANLCLTPAIREAYQTISLHDKKILNRMANKRSENVLAKENAWLARKFWENERYERELLKCEQMEEYKRAVRDKQFHDYLLTKERLNDLAQRDFEKLQRLRFSLAEKDASTKHRLDNVRLERDIMLCQRRCEELKKSEAVNLHHEEQHLGDVLRKQEICSRLTHRLRRADEIRQNMLDGYLKRLRYDNLVEEIVHERHRETQALEQMKRLQLKQQIQEKSKGTQRFMQQRQHRLDALSRTAKISASLRELVRNSVTPEGAFLNHAASTANLGKILFDPPNSKFSIY